MCWRTFCFRWILVSRSNLFAFSSFFVGQRFHFITENWNHYNVTEDLRDSCIGWKKNGDEGQRFLRNILCLRVLVRIRRAVVTACVTRRVYKKPLKNSRSTHHITTTGGATFPNRLYIVMYSSNTEPLDRHCFFFRNSISKSVRHFMCPTHVCGVINPKKFPSIFTTFQRI